MKAQMFYIFCVLAFSFSCNRYTNIDYLNRSDLLKKVVNDSTNFAFGFGADSLIEGTEYYSINTENIKEGKSVIVFENGHYFTGKYKDGRRIGQWEIMNRDKSVYRIFSYTDYGRLSRIFSVKNNKRTVIKYFSPL